MTQTTKKGAARKPQTTNKKTKKKKNNISRPGLPTNFRQMISLFFNLPTISLIKGNWQGLSHNLLPQSLPTNFPQFSHNSGHSVFLRPVSALHRPNEPDRGFQLIHLRDQHAHGVQGVQDVGCQLSRSRVGLLRLSDDLVGHSHALVDKPA